MKLSVLLIAVMSFVSCAASQSTPTEPWKVELRTAGGFGGRGNGSYAIDSTGAITITNISGKSCSFTAEEDELRRFHALVAAAKPASWNASYVPENNCCDRLEYTLTLQRGDTSKTVQWIDDPLPLPADLSALAEAMNGGETSLRVVYIPRCR